ncbi:hypothetical protein [Bradyrhizobium sp. ARR65]|uniref:hypothetical protein n=1 Tax=Bradyrhizobium sp. ARR65 TaxID=1040989 RepID=UPI000465C44C|nr:hypothetical protein [Bradyrhizobium sp. ARR65]
MIKASEPSKSQAEKPTWLEEIEGARALEFVERPKSQNAAGVWWRSTFERERCLVAKPSVEIARQQSSLMLGEHAGGLRLS